MTVEATRPAPLRLARPADEFEFSRFLFEVSAVPGVRKLGYSRGAHQVDLWVLVDREDFDLNGRIYDLQEAYRESAELTPMELHIVPLDHVREDRLPAFRLMWERR